MTTSQNGWTINPPGMTPLVVNGVTFGPCHPGDAFTVLEYVATRYDREVEHLIKGTCGCYNPRQIPGSSVWSNHASATAIDCNWQRHPLGARGTYSSAQVAAIRRIVADCDGVIRWGGIYTTTVDEMHFEINKGAAAVTALAAKIRNEDDSMAGLTAADVQAAAKAGFISALSDAYTAAMGQASADTAADKAKRNIRDFLRAVVGGPTADVDEVAVAAAVLAGLNPQLIAAAIPAELAREVADELATRLAS